MPTPTVTFSFAPAATSLAWTVQEGAPQGDAPAQGAPPSGSPGLFGSMWFPILMMVAIFWLIVIGPERKNRKRRDAMLSALEKGDRVVTTGGLFGQVVGVQDNVVTLQVAEGVRMRFARHAIQTVLEGEGAEATAAAAKDPKAR